MHLAVAKGDQVYRKLSLCHVLLSVAQRWPQEHGLESENLRHVKRTSSTGRDLCLYNRTVKDRCIFQDFTHKSFQFRDGSKPKGGSHSTFARHRVLICECLQSAPG